MGPLLGAQCCDFTQALLLPSPAFTDAVMPPDLEPALAFFALGMQRRTLPFVWLIPAFGGPSLPARVRLALGFCALSPVFPADCRFGFPRRPVLLLLLALRECGVGLVMGFVAACMFRAVEAAGRLTDTLRGANLADVIAPGRAVAAARWASYCYFCPWWFFLEAGGRWHPCHGPGSQLRSGAARCDNGRAPGRLHAAAFLVIVASAKLIEGRYRVGGSALVALLLADLALGAPGPRGSAVPLYFVGMPARPCLAWARCWQGLATLDSALTLGFRGFLVLLERAAQLGR